MHRRGVILLLGFLLAVAVVGGSGVGTPWLPANERVAMPVGPTVGGPRITVGGPRIAVGTSRMRME